MLDFEYQGYNITGGHYGSNYMIKAKGQGKVPKDLIGFYTNKVEAMKGVDRYLQSLKKGKRSNAKKASGS